MTTIINYGLGNIEAFANIFRRLNLPVSIADSPNDLNDAKRLILPGVGAFDWAMTRLNQSKMRDKLDDLVLGHKLPVLGVCVGMQIMATSSEEGDSSGLNWISGNVKRFDKTAFKNRTHLPHMGWNEVAPLKSSGIFSGIKKGARFYFLHSYYFSVESQSNILAETNYNGDFASAVGGGNVFGVQFHPEKSHDGGLRLLKNFSKL